MLRSIRKRKGARDLEWEDGSSDRCPYPVFRRLELEEDAVYDRDQVRNKIVSLSRTILPDKARDHLARYPKTTQRFRLHFEQRGYPPDLIEELIPGLREEQFLDDESLARRHVEKRCENRPRGRRKLVAELREKGIERELARSVVDELVPDERERSLLDRFCEANPGEDPDSLGRKLQTRGFPAHLIRRAVNERR